MNLYNEIMEKLTKYDYTVSDILAITCEEFNIGLENFLDVAKKTDYDTGFGSTEIAEDLKILMKDGSWFERREYDGAEWFEHVVPPKPHRVWKYIFRLKSSCYNTKVAQMNN